MPRGSSSSGRANDRRFFTIFASMPPANAQQQLDADDSDIDYEPMDARRTLMTLSRADVIKVIQFADPRELSCCRLSSSTTSC